MVLIKVDAVVMLTTSITATLLAAAVAHAAAVVDTAVVSVATAAAIDARQQHLGLQQHNLEKEGGESQNKSGSSKKAF